MNYEGKLYGKTVLGYFDTGHTSKDWDDMEETISELRENQNELVDKIADYLFEQFVDDSDVTAVELVNMLQQFKN